MDECGLSATDLALWPISLISFLDISIGHSLLNNYLLSTSFALGSEVHWECQVLSWSLSFYMDYCTSLLVDFLAFNFSASNLVSIYCLYELPKTQITSCWPLSKNMPGFSSPAELNFLFVDRTVKVFINFSQLTPIVFLSNQFLFHNPHWVAGCPSMVMPCIVSNLTSQITRYKTRLGFAVPLI